MKKIIVALLVIAPFFCKAQSFNRDDSLAIDKACKDYVEGFYTGDTNRIRQAMYPDLVKRVVLKKMNYKIYSSTVDDLIKAASSGQKPPDPNPNEPFKITVNIYDIAYGIAIAKISTNKMKFIDYVQVAQINGEWKIMNVLWAFTQ